MSDLVTERPLRGIRRVIAQRLGKIWGEAVHVTIHRDLDLTGLLDYRENKKPPFSTIDYVLRAVCRSLLIHGELNGTFEEQVHKISSKVHLGYAVDTDRGLVVPIIRDAANKELDELSNERKRIIDLAKQSEYTLEDVSGGTFTVTNLAGYGVDYFTPIINPPQVAILGFGRLRVSNVSWDRFKEPTPKTILPASLTFDHRVIDGASAAYFLHSLDEMISDPESLET